MFVQNDSSGRLPYGTVPEVLQGFGIALTENDLVSAAKELNFNGDLIELFFTLANRNQ